MSRTTRQSRTVRIDVTHLARAAEIARHVEARTGIPQSPAAIVDAAAGLGLATLANGLTPPEEPAR